MMIAVTGMGGVGKTVTSALILRSLLLAGHRPLLAIDAGTRPRLHRTLGMQKPLQVAGLLDELLAAESGGAPKQGLVEALLNQRVLEGQGIDLVVFGAKGEAQEDRFAGNLLRRAMGRLAGNYLEVVVDEGEGMEHLSRRNLAVIEHLVIVAAPSAKGAAEALALADLSDRLCLRVQKKWLLVNHAAAGSGVAGGASGMRRGRLPAGVLLLGEIPHDPLVGAWEGEGRSFLELTSSSPAAAAVGKAVEDRLLDRAGLDTRKILDP
jgi:CO dehydrogenase maturation factor